MADLPSLWLPVDLLLTVLREKRIDLRKRPAAEKAPIGAQGAWVRGLQDEARIGAAGRDHGFFLRVRAPEDERDGLRQRGQSLHDA